MAGTAYTTEQHARVAKPWGGADALAWLAGHPEDALVELVVTIDGGGAPADFARRRGLCDSTVRAWVTRDLDRAAAYEAAREARAELLAEEVLGIADAAAATPPT